jgi:hypothetical protein
LLINLVIDDAPNADSGEAFFTGGIRAFNFTKAANRTSHRSTTHHAIIAIAYTASQTKEADGGTTSQRACRRNDGDYVNTRAVHE